MTVDKISNAPTQNELIDKVNEVIDNLGGGSGSATDVQINGTSITSSGVANIVTNSAYDASSNKIATMSDVKDVFIGTKGTTTFQQFKDAYDAGMMLYALEPDDTYGIYTFKRYYTTSSKNIFEFTRTYRYSTGIRTEVWTFSSSGDNYSDTTIIREQVQADWNETNTNSKAYIQNKPDLATVATSGDYDDLTNKPTIPENQIFIAEYNVTSYSDISTAYNAGKAIYCKYTLSSQFYYIPLVQVTSGSFVFCGTMFGDETLRMSCNRLNTWNLERTQLENTSNKVTSISKSSTDTQYPSAKCVFDLLETIYPVGSVYLSTNATCPLASLFGTWTLVSSGKALWTGTGSNGGSTISAGLPNLAGGAGGDSYKDRNPCSYPFYRTSDTHVIAASGNNSPHNVYFDASLANSIYGNSTTVQPPAYVVNVWRRTA